MPTSSIAPLTRRPIYPRIWRPLRQRLALARKVPRRIETWPSLKPVPFRVLEARARRRHGLGARVLKVSSEKMRDKLYQSLQEYMTTLARQLGRVPDREAVKQMYVVKCAEALGCEFVPGKLSERELTLAARLDRRFVSDEWLDQKGGLRQRRITIHEDVRFVESAYKAPEGLVRVTARLRHGRIDDLTLSGDFTLLPAFGMGAVEHALRGITLDADASARRIDEVYRALNLQSPGLTPDDIARAVALLL